MTLVNPEVPTNQSNVVSEQKYKEAVELINAYNKQQVKVPVEQKILEQPLQNVIQDANPYRMTQQELRDRDKLKNSVSPVETIDGYVIDKNYVKVPVVKYKNDHSNSSIIVQSILTVLIGILLGLALSTLGLNSIDKEVASQTEKIIEIEAYLDAVRENLDNPTSVEKYLFNVQKAVNYTKIMSDKIKELKQIKIIKKMMTDSELREKMLKDTQYYIVTKKEL